MLGSKSKNKSRTENSNSMNNGMPGSGTTCVIAKGTAIEGKFDSSEDVRLDGSIKGDVRCKQRVVMGESGKIDGTLHAADAVIMGKVFGEIVISGTLHLKNTATIEGNITARSMTVDEGARYNGECKVGGNVAAERKAAVPV